MLRKVGHNLLAQLVSPLLSLVDRLLIFGLLIRAWGPAVYADYAVALSAAGMLTLAECGLNIYFGNTWQKAFSTGDEPAFQRTVGVAIFLYGVILAVLLLAIVSAIATDVIARFHAVSHNEGQSVFVLLALTATARVGRGSVSQVYRGRGAFARGTLLLQAQVGISLCVVLIAAAAGARPAVLAGVELASELLLCWGLLLSDLQRRYAVRLRPTIPTKAEAKVLLRIVPWFAIQQGAPVLWLQLPVLILGWAGIAATPLVAFINMRTLVNIGRTPVTLLSIATGVEFAMSHHRDGRRAAAVQMTATGRLASALMAVIAVGVVFFGPTFVQLWTGRADLFDLRIAIVMLSGAILSTPAIPVANFLSFINQPRPVASALILQLIIGFGVIACLAPSLGALGVALGLAIGEGMFAVALPLLAARVLPFGYLGYVGRCFVTAVPVVIWSAFVGSALVWLFPISDLKTYVLAGGLFALLAAVPALVASAPAALRHRIMGALTRLSPSRDV